jgi:hypothetical protein
MLWQDYDPSKEIYKVLKQVHPDTGLTVAGMGMLMDYVKDCLYRIVECAFELSQYVTESYELTPKVVEFFVAEASADGKDEGSEENSYRVDIRDPDDFAIVVDSVWLTGAAAVAGIRSIDVRVIQSGNTILCLYDFIHEGCLSFM